MTTNNNSITIQQGDTFSLLFQYKEDDVVSVLPQGYDLVVGIYDRKGHILQHGRTKDGSVVYNEETMSYKYDITHEQSMKMIGKIAIELTIVTDENTVVDHASDIVYIEFEARKNNDIL